MGGISRSRALCAGTGTGSSSGFSDAGRGQRHISPLIPLLFFPLVPPTSRNFLELPRLPFLLSHTSPGRLVSYLHNFLVLFPLFIQFLQLSLLLLLFSYVLYDFYFSQTFTLFLLLVLFLGKCEKLFFGGPKVIAGDCQRLLEIVVNSTFKQLQFSLKVPPPKNCYFTEASKKERHLFNEKVFFLGRRKYH